MRTIATIARRMGGWGAPSQAGGRGGGPRTRVEGAACGACAVSGSVTPARPRLLSQTLLTGAFGRVALRLAWQTGI